jgi:hypothetical protein
MPAVSECAYAYPDGRRCHRLPARGEALCRDHRRGQIVTHRQDEEAFVAEHLAFADHLRGHSLTAILDELQQALIVLEPLEDNPRTPYHVRAALTRASIAVSAALDISSAMDSALLDTDPAGIRVLPPLTSEQFASLRGTLETFLKSNACQ